MRRHTWTLTLRRAKHLGGEHGQTLVEYALIIAVVSLGAVAALTFLRDEITSVFTDSGSTLSTAGAAGGSTPPPPPAAPATPTITSGPSEGSVVTATNASFAFTGDGSQTSFECRFDAAAVFTTCTSPQAYAGLALGAHTFRVQASNSSGSSTPATRTWTVGTAPTGVNVAIACAPGAAFCNVGDTATANLTGQPGVPAPTMTYLWERNTALAATCGAGSNWTTIGSGASVVLPAMTFIWDPVRVTVTWSNVLGTVNDSACVLYYP